MCVVVLLRTSSSVPHTAVRGMPQSGALQLAALLAHAIMVYNDVVLFAATRLLELYDKAPREFKDCIECLDYYT